MSLLVDALAVAFWASAGLVLYAYVGYPVLIWVLSRVFGRKPAPPAVADADLPSVSILVAAFNEEKEIGDRIVNALKQDYPKGMLEVVIASDGSSDRTNEIASGFEEHGVRLLDYPVRRGKATVLNDAFGELAGRSSSCRTPTPTSATRAWSASWPGGSGTRPSGRCAASWC